MSFNYYFFHSQLQLRIIQLNGERDAYLKTVWRSLLSAVLVLLLTSCAIKRSNYDVPVYQLPAQFKNQLPTEPVPKAAAQGEGAGSEATNVQADAMALSASKSDAKDEVKNDAKGNPEANATAEENPSSNAVTSPAATPAATAFSINEWWLLFGSDELSALIDRGMANNPDIRIATLHISQAKLRSEQAHAGQLPTLDTSFTAGPQKGSSPASSVSGASVNLNWQLDVWGEQAALSQEADFQLWQTIFDANNMKRNIAASIATSYIEYLLSCERLKIARDTEKILSDLLITMEKRASVGDATMFELEQQRSAIYSERSLIPNLEQQREEAIESLAYLLGTVPSALTLSDADLDSLHLPDTVPNLPSTMLLRRPDVRSMEARLLAADVDIDVMRARLLPQVGLTAQTGYSGLVSQLFRPETFFWNMFTNVTGNVFDAGKQSAMVKQSVLMHEEMVESYARTILQAVREVERALYSIRVSGQRTKLQNEAMSSAQKAWDISNKVYSVGGVDFMSLQETQRTYRRYIEDYQHVRADYYHAYINLFQALGGGEDVDSALPGKGARPAMPATVLASNATPPVFSSATQTDKAKVKWQANIKDDKNQQEYWQVALAGHYQLKTIDAVARDLQKRFPAQMEQHDIYPVLEGQLGDAKVGQQSWYQLNIAKFTSAEKAQELCKLLRADLQRCSVTSSRNVGQVANQPAERPKELIVASATPVASKALQDSVASAQPKEPPTTSHITLVDLTKTEAKPELPSTAFAPAQPEAIQPIQISALPKNDNAQASAPVVAETGKPVQAAEMRKQVPNELTKVAQQPPENVAPKEPEKVQAPAVMSTPSAEIAKEPENSAPMEVAEQFDTPESWTIELTERVPRRQIGAVLRDLRLRYPSQMAQKKLYSAAEELLGGKKNLQQPNYKLTLDNFDNAKAAVDFCAALRTDSQGCHVYSNRSQVPLPEAVLATQ